jgi:hypothetical protein
MSRAGLSAKWTHSARHITGRFVSQGVALRPPRHRPVMGAPGRPDITQNGPIPTDFVNDALPPCWSLPLSGEFHQMPFGNDRRGLLGARVQECKLKTIGSSCSGAITVVDPTSCDCAEEQECKSSPRHGPVTSDANECQSSGWPVPDFPVSPCASVAGLQRCIGPNQAALQCNALHCTATPCNAVQCCNDWGPASRWERRKSPGRNERQVLVSPSRFLLS